MPTNKPKGVFMMSVKESWKRVGSDLNDIGDDIASSDLGKDVLKFGVDFGKSMVKTVKAGIKAVADWADKIDEDDVIEDAAEKVERVAEDIVEEAKVIFADAGDAVEEAGEAVADAVDEVAEEAADEAADAADAVADAVEDMTDKL